MCIYIYMCGCVCVSGGVRAPTQFPSDASKICQKLEGVCVAPKTAAMCLQYHMPHIVISVHKYIYIYMCVYIYI